MEPEPSGDLPKPMRVSYAQNFEDVRLDRAFGGAEGFYVDLGAGDPVAGSVTKLFYDRGWSGLNVEPSSLFGRLLAERPRDVNLQVAVGREDGEAEFHEYPGDAVMESTLFPDRSARRGAITKKVAVRRLAGILDEHAAGRDISFLKMDVEGAEADAIAGNDWTRFRPEVVVVEATEPWSSRTNHGEWEPMLLAAGFDFVTFDGINRFYVRAESRHLRNALEAPVSALDFFERYDPRVAELARVQAQLEAVSRERDAFHAQVEELARTLADHDRLVGELRLDHGPVALRAVLPLARLLRATSERVRGRRGGGAVGPSAAAKVLGRTGRERSLEEELRAAVAAVERIVLSETVRQEADEHPAPG